MRAAIALAARHLGATWPNPSVGCVIVRDGRVVGRGVTGVGGTPHAETVALAMAVGAARGATAYVTLEPCAHHGRTPPCADALIAAGIARVVVGIGDPHAKVDGAGLRMLRDAGIAVELGVLAEQAAAVTAGFLTRTLLGRPMVTLKLATTLDGRIATRGGQSRWITGPAARRAAHALRGRHDGVLVGVGTAIADDPDLTCRIPGYAPRQPVRIVADGTLRTSLVSRLVATAGTVPTWFLHRASAPAERCAAFAQAGVRLLPVAGSEIGVDPASALQALGTAGLTGVLVEGGARLAAALLRAGLVDRICWFHAPAVMGGDGVAAAQAFGIVDLVDMPRYRRVGMCAVGDDMLTEYARD